MWDELFDFIERETTTWALHIKYWQLHIYAYNLQEISARQSGIKSLHTII